MQTVAEREYFNFKPKNWVFYLITPKDRIAEGDSVEVYNSYTKTLSSKTVKISSKGMYVEAQDIAYFGTKKRLYINDFVESENA